MFPYICCLPFLFKWMVIRPPMNRGTGTITACGFWPETSRCLWFAIMSLIMLNMSALFWFANVSALFQFALYESWLERVWNVAKNCLTQPKRWFYHCQSKPTFYDYRHGIPSAAFWWRLGFWQQKISPSQMIPQVSWSLQWTFCLKR